MSTFGWILFSISMAGCIWGWRYVFTLYYDSLGKMDGEDIFLAAMLGALTCMLWPFLLIHKLCKNSLPRNRHTQEVDWDKFARHLKLTSRSEKKAKRLAKETT